MTSGLDIRGIRSRRREWTTAVLVLAVGAMATVAVTLEAASALRDDRKDRLRDRAEQAQSVIEQRIDAYVEVLHGMRGLFEASDSVGREEFRTYVAGLDLDERLPGSRGSSFARAVPAEEIPAFEAAVRAEAAEPGLTGNTHAGGTISGFTVKPPRDDGTAIVAEFLEPLPGNEAALGIDVARESVRLAAIEDAVATGETAITAPIRLFDNPDGAPSFMMFLPVFDTGEPLTTVDAHWEHLTGVVVIVVTVHEMVEALGLRTDDVDLDLYDVGPTAGVSDASRSLSATGLLYDSNPGSSGRAGSAMALDLDVASPRWRVIATPTQDLAPTAARLAPWGTAGAGALVTLALAGLVVTAQRSRRRAVVLAEEMTQELRDHTAELTRLSAIVGASSDALFRVDLPDAVIGSWNRGAEAIYGWTAEEAIGRPISLLVPPTAVAASVAMTEHVRQGGTVHRQETVRRRRDGTDLVVSVSLGPIRHSSGEVVAISSVHRDITEITETRDQLARAHHELQLRAADLERSNAELERFAYITSHDLQEPLRTINSFVTRLGERYGEHVDDRGRQYMSFVTEATTRMQALIVALLDYSHVGRSNVVLASTNSAALVNALVADIASIDDGGAGPIDVGDLPIVQADAVLLRQLVQNLVTNARKFARPGSAAHVTISAERGSGAWVFSVDDDGIGIAPEYREQVFAVFKRLHSAAEYPGTGIGLSICQRIVELHGGEIWVADSPLGGARFSFTIPDAIDTGVAPDTSGEPISPSSSTEPIFSTAQTKEPVRT